MFSCQNEKPTIQFITSKELSFPSASAIEFYNNKLYVFGDDAPYLLVLSPNYQVLDSIGYWAQKVDRISKDEKPDIESAVIIDSGGKPVLYGIGSMSDTERWNVLAYHPAKSSITTTAFFSPGTTFPQIDAINIEGSCLVNNTLILSNRANLSNPVNYLLFWNQRDRVISKKIVLPPGKIAGGVSGLYYVKEKDILLFTASEEETASTTKDGAIGESYLGWIQGFSKKMNASEFKPDAYLELSDANKVFSKQKIESVCAENIYGNEMTLHLAADNDDGSSTLFKVKLHLQ